MAVRFVNLSHREHLAADVEDDLSVVDRIRAGGFILACPESGATQPAAFCLKCPLFEAIGRVEITGISKPPFEKIWRIVCGASRKRRIGPSRVPKAPSYRKALLESLDGMIHVSEETRTQFREIFVEGAIAINCPLSRAKAGAWRVENPPCPACSYFRGLGEEKGAVRVLCAHPKSITLTRPITGSMSLLET